MPTAVECICCREVDEVVNKAEEAQCITQHDGFEAVCLNVWVLQTAYFSYRQRYGTRDVQSQPLHQYVIIQLLYMYKVTFLLL